MTAGATDNRYMTFVWRRRPAPQTCTAAAKIPEALLQGILGRTQFWKSRRASKPIEAKRRAEKVSVAFNEMIAKGEAKRSWQLKEHGSAARHVSERLCGVRETVKN
jgi:hypothetical protein